MRKGRRWLAQISAEKTKLHLGVFDTCEEAANAYAFAAEVLQGDFAHFSVVQ